MPDRGTRLLKAALQVLPFAAGEHPGMEGSFVLRFPDNAGPDTVYVTMTTGGVYQENAKPPTR